MGKIAIVTDSNSGITQAQAEELGVYVIPMPFYINEKMYLEGVTLTQEEFYEKLKKDEPISTSQPSPADLCDLWDKLLALLEVHKVNFNWVKGHAGHPENERCDELAVMGSKQYK